MKNEIVLFESSDNAVRLEVAVNQETVWQNRNQLAMLFDRDERTIGKHIDNVMKEELQGEISSVANLATVKTEGVRQVERQVEHYNLDVIISVGYRVKSKRGVYFAMFYLSDLR